MSGIGDSEAAWLGRYLGDYLLLEAELGQALLVYQVGNPIPDGELGPARVALTFVHDASTPTLLAAVRVVLDAEGWGEEFEGLPRLLERVIGDRNRLVHSLRLPPDSPAGETIRLVATRRGKTTIRDVDYQEMRGRLAQAVEQVARLTVRILRRERERRP